MDGLTCPTASIATRCGTVSIRRATDPDVHPTFQLVGADVVASRQSREGQCWRGTARVGAAGVCPLLLPINEGERRGRREDAVLGLKAGGRGSVVPRGVV